MNVHFKIGEQSPEFSLIGRDYKVYTLSYFKGSRATIIVFLDQNVEQYHKCLQYFNKLAEQYHSNCISFIAIYPNDLADIEFPNSMYTTSLFDNSRQTTIKYGVEKFPHFFILDSKKYLVYQGRGNYTNQFDKDPLKNAIREYINASPISDPLTSLEK